MKPHIRTWPRRFVRWLFGGPFQKLPAPFGSPVPPELQRFEAEADDARHHGLGQVATSVPAHHQAARSARSDESLERQ